MVNAMCCDALVRSREGEAIGINVRLFALCRSEASERG